MSELATFTRTVTTGKETIEFLWVVGPDGAASTWFSDTRSTLGYSVYGGAAVHSPRERDGFSLHGECEFLEAPCWCASYMVPIIPMRCDPVVIDYDAGDREPVFAWLARYYHGVFTKEDA
jgi:hypothetical protein